MLNSFEGRSQNNPYVKDINEQVWAKFKKAFETYDHDLFASIHSKDLIRITGNNKRIKHYTDYMAGYKERWETTVREQTISFRFLERIADNLNGSERGIYQLTINPNTDMAENHYGKFHVVLGKENAQWKILVDYDSNEKNTINEISYKKAFAIDDLDKY